MLSQPFCLTHEDLYDKSMVRERQQRKLLDPTNIQTCHTVLLHQLNMIRNCSYVVHVSHYLSGALTCPLHSSTGYVDELHAVVPSSLSAEARPLSRSNVTALSGKWQGRGGSTARRWMSLSANELSVCETWDCDFGGDDRNEKLCYTVLQSTGAASFQTKGYCECHAQSETPF